MTLKSLVAAAAIAGGLAISATAANAAVIDYLTVANLPGASSGLGTAALTSAGDFTLGGNSYANYTVTDGTGSLATASDVAIDLTPLGSPSYGIFSIQLASGDDIQAINPADGVFSSKGYTVTSQFVTNVTAQPSGFTITSAAPEPGIWALMIAGVAMIGGAMRVSRKQDGALAAA